MRFSQVVVSAVLFALSGVTLAAVYSEPAYGQVERLIAATTGAPVAKPQGVYSKPTYGQIERLITATGDTRKQMTVAPKRLGAYLWELGTEGEDFDLATNRLMAAYPNVTGGCSGLCTTNFHGRTLDWYFSRQASLLIRKGSSEGKHGFVGIGDGAIDDAFLESGVWTNAYISVPFTLSDGLNDAGVVIQQNVIPRKDYTNWPSGSVNWHTNDGSRVICFCIIRYALERCATAQAAANLIKTTNLVPSAFPYDFHYLVSDRTSSYIVEDGKVYSTADGIPTDALTNFRVGGVSYNASTKKVSDWSTVEPYGMGVERYNLLRNGGTPASAAAMLDVMKTVWYTDTYEHANPEWPTEFCAVYTNGEITVSGIANHDPATEALLETVYDEQRDIYDAEHDSNDPAYRGGKSWQTVHTSVYDKQNLTLTLLTQEDPASTRVISCLKYATNDKMTDVQVATIAETVVSNDLSNIKINGQALSPNVTVTTYAPFKQAWVNASVTNIAAFFAAVAADSDAKAGTAFLGGLKKNSTPTFQAQVEAELKIMKSAADNSLIYVVTVYSTDQAPYFWFNMYHNGSVSGWRKYLQSSDVASCLTGVTINGTALSVNSRVASGTVVTCSPLPEGTLHEGVSTLTLCKSIATNAAVVKGMMYLGHAGLTEGDDNTFPRGGEITVKCLQADRDLTQPDNVTQQGCVILELTFTSTGTGLRHWMCVYEYFGLKHPLNDDGRGDYPNGKPAFGTLSMPWYGIPFRPFPGQEDGPNPLAMANTAALLTDVDACTNVMKNQYFNLSNDSDLRDAVRLLVRKLGGAAN